MERMFSSFSVYVSLLTLIVCSSRSIVLCMCCASASSSVDWGTYRPGLYFGVKASVPLSPVFALMYTDPDLHDSYNHVRHDCDDRDHMEGFGYSVHDGGCIGVQSLPDGFIGVNLSTVFMQKDDGFTVRIEGRAMPGRSVEKLSLIWYMALENPEHSFEAPESQGSHGLDGDISIKMNFGSLGRYRMVTQRPASNSYPSIESSTRRRHQTMDKTYFTTCELEQRKFWEVKEQVRSSMIASQKDQIRRHMNVLATREKQQKRKSGDTSPPSSYEKLLREVKETQTLIPTLPGTVVEDANVLVLQNIFNLPFSIDIAVVPESVWDSAKKTSDDDEDDDDDDDDDVPKLPKHVLLDSSLRDAEMGALLQKFDDRFKAAFNLEKKGFSEEKIAFAKTALSNMLGSMGFFHGTSLHRSVEGDSVYEQYAESLLAVVPARAFFPRGFLWDSGFHQLLVSSYDLETSEKVISSWARLIEHSGWLPREQILGTEARSRVPSEFQVQNPHVANPPTLFLSILKIIKRAKLLPEDTEFSAEVDIDAKDNSIRSPKADIVVQERVRTLLKEMYPLLVRHVNWYLSTQAASRENSFRWRMRTTDHCLASGLDDFPRAPFNLLSGPDDEGHVDLHSWMIFICRAISVIGSVIGEDVSVFQQKAAELAPLLDEYHWDKNELFYFDYFREINATDYSFARARGYVNLFPLALELVEPDSLQLKALLDFVGDDQHVWTDFGIRSLSLSDPHFGTNENYWRGPIWYNLNYLIASALHGYGERKGPYQQQAQRLYQELRSNLINNAFKVHKDTGYLWEQYDGDTGAGKRSHPFTGWTALVVSMMAEDF